MEKTNAEPGQPSESGAAAKSLYDFGNVVVLEEANGGDAGCAGFEAGAGVR